jgi:signal transduction histidine kinase
MEQALHGLVSNAIDASPNGAKLVVKLTSLKDTVAIHIVDEGAGIPFVPVASDLAPGPTTKRFGTGLGIPFALKVCEEHGGEIIFNANAPRGTEVIICLPKLTADPIHDA